MLEGAQSVKITVKGLTVGGKQVKDFNLPSNIIFSKAPKGWFIKMLNDANTEIVLPNGTITPIVRINDELSVVEPNGNLSLYLELIYTNQAGKQNNIAIIFTGQQAADKDFSKLTGSFRGKFSLYHRSDPNTVVDVIEDGIVVLDKKDENSLYKATVKGLALAQASGHRIPDFTLDDLKLVEK